MVTMRSVKQYHVLKRSFLAVYRAVSHCHVGNTLVSRPATKDLAILASVHNRAQRSGLHAVTRVQHHATWGRQRTHQPQYAPALFHAGGLFVLRARVVGDMLTDTAAITPETTPK